MCVSVGGIKVATVCMYKGIPCRPIQRYQTSWRRRRRWWCEVRKERPVEPAVRLQMRALPKWEGEREQNRTQPQTAATIARKSLSFFLFMVPLGRTCYTGHP